MRPIFWFFRADPLFGTQVSALNNPLDIKLGDSVNIEGEDTSYDNLTGIATVGNVRINCGDTNIYAGKAEYHNTTGDIFGGPSINLSRRVKFTKKVMPQFITLKAVK